MSLKLNFWIERLTDLTNKYWNNYYGGGFHN